MGDGEEPLHSQLPSSKRLVEPGLRPVAGGTALERGPPAQWKRRAGRFTIEEGGPVTTKPRHARPTDVPPDRRRHEPAVSEPSES
jgi:hypothetical protein